MSIIESQQINPHLLTHKEYRLAIKNSQSGTLITMFLQTPFFHTKHLPKTHKILSSDLPQVLRTQCFNELDLPFNVEVKNTEIGHLFEHILLEFLCQIKIKNGFSKASFRGVTKWNWKKDAKGTFHIKIETQPEDLIFFESALSKSMTILNKILLSQKQSVSSLVN